MNTITIYRTQKKHIDKAKIGNAIRAVLVFGTIIGLALIIMSIPEPEPEPKHVTGTMIYTFHGSAEEDPEPVYLDCPLNENQQDYIRSVAGEYGLPLELIVAVIETESDFRPNLISGKDYGLMQINKTNHAEFRTEYGIDDFLDPYQNMFCGITILGELYERYGDIDRALMAYNCGRTGAAKLAVKGVLYTNYVIKVRNNMRQYYK